MNFPVTLDYNYYWTSATKQPNGQWIWWDLQPIVSTNWAPNEPNNLQGIETCLQLYPKGQWNDQDCTRVNFFICESRNTGSSSTNVNCYEPRPAAIVNVYVNNNLAGSENGTVAQTKRIASPKDGEWYNVEVNNNIGTCDSPKAVTAL